MCIRDSKINYKVQNAHQLCGIFTFVYSVQLSSAFLMRSTRCAASVTVPAANTLCFIISNCDPAKDTVGMKIYNLMHEVYGKPLCGYN